MKKFLKIIGSTLLILLLIFIYYYLTLPAINIHSSGFWYFIIILSIFISVFIGIFTESFSSKKAGQSLFKNNMLKVSISVTLVLLFVYIVGGILSSPIVNSSKYRDIINITDRDFTEDIKEISFNDIPLLDKDSATLLGSRKMGSMVEYVSQFEVADDYTQINFNSAPIRVTPLVYGSFFKWLTNKSAGIPAYIKIDMTTQNVECIKLNSGIKYSNSERFGRNINRYLRFNYPTYIFDKLNFEIDDNGTPYWICPVKNFSIGLFGGQGVSHVVLVNAVTGQHNNYKIHDVPNWVDKVYPAELLISYYDYFGTLKHGYWNTLFSQKDCLETTDGYNYLALEDDVWVYTGVTSVSGDESNVGFVLMNQRTAETRYYSISGAEEYSAMGSAEGQVQHLGYHATFPLLLNIANEPTYFLALKDDAGLVKKYAMVNVAKYQNVSIGDTVNECEKTYIAMLKTSGITVATDIATLPTLTGVISKIAEGVIDGNSHYYIMLEGNKEIFDVSVVDYINIIKFNVGDTISLTYITGNDTNVVLDIQ